MPKRPAGKNHNTKPVPVDALPDMHRENNSQMIEMAADQFADLLWRHWLYMRKLKEKGSKEPDS